MKKLLVFTPVYKRPEILKIYVEGLRRIRKRWPNMEVLCIISNEDPHLEEVVPILEWDCTFFRHPNLPLGEKKNKGLAYALKELEWDYLMELNSDGVMDLAAFDIYEDLINDNVEFAGFEDVYFFNYETGKVYKVHDYAGGMSFGSGRIYRRDILPHELWPRYLSSGLDTMSRKKLMRMGYEETVIEGGPYVVDIKTSTNIFPWELVENPRLVKNKVEVDYSEIKDKFGL